MGEEAKEGGYAGETEGSNVRCECICDPLYDDIGDLDGEIVAEESVGIYGG